MTLLLLARGHAVAQSTPPTNPDNSNGLVGALRGFRFDPGWLHLGTWEGSVETDYGTGHDLTRSDTGSDLAFARHHTAERVSIRNSGFYLIDPALASGSLGLTFGLLRDHSSSNAGPATSSRANLVGYSFDTTILGELPYSGTLHANRSQSISSQPFGRVESAYESRGAALRLSENSPLRDWGYPYLSGNLRVEQQHTQETSTSVLGQTFRRDETRNTISQDGHKGFETADLDWRYEFNQFKNPVFPQGDYHSHLANLGYSRDFGPGLNRRWDSRISYNARYGTIPFSLFTANEALRIEHNTNLATSYNYFATRTQTAAGSALSQTGSAQVLYRPFRNLAAQMSETHQVLPAGARNILAGGLNYNYQRRLPWSGSLSAHAATDYTVVDSHLNAALIGVNDEAHATPAALGAGAGFLLDQAFVATSTIVVVDTRGGSRLSTSLGIDYDVVADGNSIRVMPLPTSAVIQAGDPLAVSYSYRLDPSLKYSTGSRSVGATMDYRWIVLSVDHAQSEQKAISGLDNGFLQNTRNDSAGLDLRGAWRKVQGQAGVSSARYDSTRIAYTQRRAYQNASYRPRPNFGLAFNADWTATDYTLPARRSDTRSAQFVLDWNTPGGWTTSALLGRRLLKDSALPGETITEASLRAQLKYGKILLMSAFTFNDRIRGGYQMNNWRADLSATRNF